MIQRDLAQELVDTAQQFPVVAVVGPRQSGKTTLVVSLFKNYKYVTFDDLDVRRLAQTDPRSFLESMHGGVGCILDEVQYVPELFSYIKTFVDLNKGAGQFILTGSQNFLLNDQISQSLAGRVAILTLLPLSSQELERVQLLDTSIERVLFKGCYPRIFDENISPEKWYKNYIQTYIERDVRTIKSIENLSTFQMFVKLCAGRIGQVLNLTSLGNDCGISTNTARAWLSILESSYIVYVLHPHFKNFSKRLIKSPKLYFYDTGLACSLLDIENETQLQTHYMRGNLFESFVISELIKHQYNHDKKPNLFYWRDSQGHEIDCLIEKGEQLTPIEVKIGKTLNSDFFENLTYWMELSGSVQKAFLIYGGNETLMHRGIQVLGWRSIDSVFK
jgi:predicted AAA+ superfamily ATPase